MSNRHRRTRIYGANYDIGESYYKKQLNDLDSKKEVIRSNISPDKKYIGPKVKFLSEDLNFDDKNTNIRTFNFNNNNDEVHTIQDSLAYKTDEPDIFNKLRRTNAYDLKDESFNKHKTLTKVQPIDYDFDEEYIKNYPKTTKEFSVDIDRYHNSFGNNSNRLLCNDIVDRKKSAINLEEEATSLRSKFTSDKSIRKEYFTEEEDASCRANVSKARLLDLEEQIMSISNKQNEREKRNKNLKKILSEVSGKQ